MNDNRKEATSVFSENLYDADHYREGVSSGIGANFKKGTPYSVVLFGSNLLGNIWRSVPSAMSGKMTIIGTVGDTHAISFIDEGGFNITISFKLDQAVTTLDVVNWSGFDFSSQPETVVIFNGYQMNLNTK